MFPHSLVLKFNFFPRCFKFRHIASHLQTLQYIQTSHVRRIPAYTSFSEIGSTEITSEEFRIHPCHSFQTDPTSQLFLLLCRGAHRSHSDPSPESLAGSTAPHLLQAFPQQLNNVALWRFFCPIFKVASSPPSIWLLKIRQVYGK